MLVVSIIFWRINPQVLNNFKFSYFNSKLICYHLKNTLIMFWSFCYKQWREHIVGIEVERWGLKNENFAREWARKGWITIFLKIIIFYKIEFFQKLETFILSWQRGSCVTWTSALAFSWKQLLNYLGEYFWWARPFKFTIHANLML